jgi:hypothetical protein
MRNIRASDNRLTDKKSQCHEIIFNQNIMPDEVLDIMQEEEVFINDVFFDTINADAFINEAYFDRINTEVLALKD